MPRHQGALPTLKLDHGRLVDVTDPAACVPVENKIDCGAMTTAHISNFVRLPGFFSHVHVSRPTPLTGEVRAVLSDVGRRQLGGKNSKERAKCVTVFRVKYHLMATGPAHKKYVWASKRRCRGLAHVASRFTIGNAAVNLALVASPNL